jgi:ABC-type nitrate/sulfonate/bicarbonate transport system permease component
MHSAAGKHPKLAPGAAGLAAFLTVGEAVPRLGLVKEAYFPPVSTIAGAFAGELSGPALWTALGDTLTGRALGPALAVAGGLPAGVLLSVVRYPRERPPRRSSSSARFSRSP